MNNIMLFLFIFVAEPDKFQWRNNGEVMIAAPRYCEASPDLLRLVAIVKFRRPIGLFSAEYIICD